MIRNFKPVALIALLAAGCGTLPVSTGAPQTTARVAAASTSVTEDLSFLDVAGYLKVARLYVTWHLFHQDAQLDYAGCRWLDESGLVLKGTAGWTFGYYHRPENSAPRSAYAVVQVNQKHSASAGNAADVVHRGISTLSLSSMLTPRESIQEALKQNLPKGDRYAVEYLSASAEAPSTAVITSFRGTRSLGVTSLPSKVKR